VIRTATFAAFVLGLFAGPAFAQPDQERPEPGKPVPLLDDDDDDDDDGALSELRVENEALRDELEILKEDVEHLQKQVTTLLPVKNRISGYLDFGFFYVGGDGRGFRIDQFYDRFPEYDGVVPGQWVFMGDPLSTMINARGDPADVAESRAITYNQVGNRGAASFMVNTLNLQLFTGIGDNLTLTSFVDFVPRGRDFTDSNGLSFGDFVDVKLAYVEYLAPVESFDLNLYAGKFDSVVGYEYRVQESPDRITVTPSLICRYLCGHPLGIKARASFLDRALIAAVSVTNGSHFTEGFNFADEVDSNDIPTVAGRLSYALPFGKEVEIGVSGAYGAQDAQGQIAPDEPRNDVFQWHIGADMRVLVGDVELYAEYVKGEAEGEAGSVDCEIAACLEYQGAYGLLAYRITNAIVPFARIDWRDALHLKVGDFVYISELWRATAGLRAEIGTNVIIKAEYTVNRELGRVPQFANDVFTSALIVRY
jgi:hypothetical protein